MIRQRPRANWRLRGLSPPSWPLAAGTRTSFLTADTYLVFAEWRSQKGQNALPHPRCRHAMAKTGDGKVVVAGGVTQDKDGTLALAKEVLRYDPEADNWEHVTDLPLRTSQCVVEIIDNRLFVIAGDTGTTTEPGYPIAPAKCRGNVQIYDLKSGKWSEGARSQPPRRGLPPVRNNEIFVVSSSRTMASWRPAVDVYDVKQDKWRRIPTCRLTGVACGFVKDRLDRVNGLGSELKAISVAEVYDPETNKWTKAPQTAAPSYASGYAVSGGALMIMGGRK